MRRQTSSSGVAPAGSSRGLRLDPLSLPLQFDARDTRADGGIRHVELDRERITVRRAVSGMRMALNIRVSEFIGIALRDFGDEQALVLVHRDPSLTLPLLITAEPEEIDGLWQLWSDCLKLPKLTREEEAAARGHKVFSEPTPRRRRRNAIRARRPKFLVRRRAGHPVDGMSVHRDEREIIARN